MDVIQELLAKASRQTEGDTMMHPIPFDAGLGVHTLTAFNAHDDFAFQLLCEASDVTPSTELVTKSGRRKGSRSRRRQKEPLEPDIPFVEKLYQQLNASRSRLMSWNVRGNGFLVVDADEFARRELPVLFKHKSFAQFTHDLRVHGFRATVLSNSASMIRSFEFRHPSFVRGRPSELKNVTAREVVAQRDPCSTPQPPPQPTVRPQIPPAATNEEHVERGAARDVDHLKSEITELSSEVQQAQTLLDQLVESLLLPTPSSYPALAQFSSTSEPSLPVTGMWAPTAEMPLSAAADDQLLSLFAEP